MSFCRCLPVRGQKRFPGSLVCERLNRARTRLENVAEKLCGVLRHLDTVRLTWTLPSRRPWAIFFAGKLRRDGAEGGSNGVEELVAPWKGGSAAFRHSMKRGIITCSDPVDVLRLCREPRPTNYGFAGSFCCQNPASTTLPYFAGFSRWPPNSNRIAERSLSW